MNVDRDLRACTFIGMSFVLALFTVEPWLVSVSSADYEIGGGSCVDAKCNEQCIRARIANNCQGSGSTGNECATAKAPTANQAWKFLCKVNDDGSGGCIIEQGAQQGQPCTMQYWLCGNCETEISPGHFVCYMSTCFDEDGPCENGEHDGTGGVTNFNTSCTDI